MTPSRALLAILCALLGRGDRLARADGFQLGLAPAGVRVALARPYDLPVHVEGSAEMAWRIGPTTRVSWWAGGGMAYARRVSTASFTQDRIRWEPLVLVGAGLGRAPLTAYARLGLVAEVVLGTEGNVGGLWGSFGLRAGGGLVWFVARRVGLDLGATLTVGVDHLGYGNAGRGNDLMLPFEAQLGTRVLF